MQIETTVQRWHCAVVDARAGVGVAMASAMLCECASCLGLWWQDRTAMDDELRVLGMAVVDVIPDDGERCALFVLGRHESAWGEDGSAVSPWGPGDLPCAPGGDALVQHGDLTALWGHLGRLVDRLDADADLPGADAGTSS